MNMYPYQPTDEHELEEWLVQGLEAGDGVEDVSTYEEASLLTHDCGIVITFENGAKYQLTICQVSQASKSTPFSGRLYWYAQAESIHDLLEDLALSQGGSWDAVEFEFASGFKNHGARLTNGPMHLWAARCPDCREIHAFSAKDSLEAFLLDDLVEEQLQTTANRYGIPDVYCQECEPQ